MDGMAIVIAVGFIVCFLAYQMIKNHVLSKVSKAMQNQNYDLVLQLSEKSFYKRFMGSFVCDLYILRALLNKGDNIGFKKYLMETLEKPYTLEKRKEVLDIYFYHFLCTYSNYPEESQLYLLRYKILSFRIRQQNCYKYTHLP